MAAQQGFYQPIASAGVTSTAGHAAALQPQPQRQWVAALTEIQTPTTGRKYGQKDRRPLDPPPVVELRIYETTPPDSAVYEEAQDYNAVEHAGFICYAELFKFSDAFAAQQSGNAISPAPLGPDVLVGSTCVQASPVYFAGKTMLVFAFPDISSKMTGDFVLRRVYKFLSMAGAGFNSPTLLSWCWGNPFKVYPSRTAPTLEPSTELTKALADAGMAVSIREKKRTRRGNRTPTADDA
uniref:Velvet domain-containing protein n=1 Tax=Mycena chlorophos TaxID=658473 RepID=A0ABQ0LRH2_MYCCL|nr:predicted protein [Mycena chlorophos]